MKKKLFIKYQSLINVLTKLHLTPEQIEDEINRRENPKPIQPKHEYIPYKEYLQSKHWIRKRKKKLDSQNHICERCHGKATQVHHISYKNLWQEPLTDLEAICGNCHMKNHEGLIQANKHLTSISKE